MIQRIQTVYLLITEVLIGLLYLLPFAGITVKNTVVYRADIQGIYAAGVANAEMVQRHWPIFLCWVAIMILIFATIFLYTNRRLQLRLLNISLLVLFCFGGLTLFELWSGAQKLSGQLSLSVYLVFPVIALVFIFLALKAIRKDDLLIRSIDRIR